MEYPNLFSPIKIGNITLRNRIVAAPMGIIANHKIPSSTNYGGMSAWDRSMGGSGMIHICGETTPIFNKYELDITKESVNVAKQDGCKVACEVGLFSMEPDEEGYIYGPMDGIRFDGQKMKGMSKEKMKSMIDEFAEFCVNCKRIGFDAVTIHAGHDSLLSQFMSPIWNQRKDEYGGSVLNRSRFVKEALEEIRKRVGDGYPIILRISRQLKIKETYTEDDMLECLKYYEGLVDMINVSCGMDVYYEANVFAVPTIFEPHSFNKEFAKKLKETTNHKVCIVGAVMTPEEGEKLIAEGYTDCVMYGRSLIADPYWPKKIMEGKADDIVPCIRCMNCYHIATGHWNIQCSVNPRFRREDRMALTRPFETNKKNITVIGGGPAGMVAAIAASDAGHTVTLYEKSDKLGGLLNWADKGPFKEDLRNYKNYLIHQVEKSNIKICLNTEATTELLSDKDIDRLIVAVGSKNREIKFKGSENMIDCLTAIDNIDSLGNKVVIVGGGSVGMEIALELSIDPNKEVTVIELANDYALNGNNLYKIALRQHVNATKNLKVVLNTKCLEIKDNKVYTTNGDFEFNTVIDACGRVSNYEEANALYGICRDTVTIGDADKIGSVIDATNVAYFVGKNA